MAILLCVLSSVLIWQIIKYKMYKSSISILYWFILNTFLSPTVYYSFLQGTSYKKFSGNAYHSYLWIGIIYVLCTIIINAFLIKSSRRRALSFHVHLPKIKNIVTIYLALVLIITVGYTVIYRDGFPLLQVLRHGNVMAALSRPDVSGDLPHYFFVQTLSTAVLPMLYFYYKEKYHISGIKNYTLLAVVIFFLTVGGNKGLLLYFFVFVWLFLWDAKLDKRIIVAAIFTLYIYELVVNGGISSGQRILDILASPIRRFFVTQGAMLINRIEMVMSGYSFYSGNISRDVFTFVYRVSGGSAPTFYLGDMIVHHGVMIGLGLSLIVLLGISIVGRNVDQRRKKRKYELWLVFYTLYLLGNSSIGANFWIRIVIMLFTLIIISMDSKSQKIVTQ